MHEASVPGCPALRKPAIENDRLCAEAPAHPKEPIVSPPLTCGRFDGTDKSAVAMTVGLADSVHFASNVRVIRIRPSLK